MSPQAKETVELLDAVFDLVDATDRSLQDDGKITVRDAGNYFGSVLKLPAAIGGIQKVPGELSELSAEARKEVLDYFAVRFELSDENLEALIEDALKTGYDFAVSVRNLARYKRAA